MAEIADKSVKGRTPQIATAALLLKGALYAQYKTQITVGNKFESKVKGAFAFLFLFLSLPLPTSPVRCVESILTIMCDVRTSDCGLCRSQAC